MIEEEVRDGVRVIKLVHGKVNAMDTELVEAIAQKFSTFAEQDAGPLVLTGHRNVFSAGVDLFRVAREGRAYLRHFLPALSRAFRAVFEYPGPVIGAINGHAIAGGCVLACACDHRVMARSDGRIGVPELYVGVPFPTVALEILRYAVSPAHLEEVVYSGRTFAPEDALPRGLINEVVEPELVLERALEQAQRYGSVRREAYALTKRDLRAQTVARYRPAETQGDLDVDTIWLDDQTVPSVEAYLERTLGAKR